MEYDVFISHASEDKQEVARPLAERLNQLGHKVWLDEIELVLGDSLRRNIDSGLSKSQFGVVILSQSFFKKEWTQKELDGLVAREDGTAKVILPIWHNVTVDDVKKYSPMLADKLGVQTNRGLSFVADRITQAIERESLRFKKIETPNVDNPLIIDKDKNGVGVFHSFGDLIVNMLDGIMDNANLQNSDNIIGLPTGFNDLDHLTSGLQPGNVILLASRPAMGKTDFLLNVASHVTVEEKLPILLYSLDNSAKEMMSRLTSIVGNINTRSLTLGLLADDEWPRLTEAIEKCRDVELLIDDKSNQNIEEIKANAKRAIEMYGAIGLIIIDSIQLIHQKDNAQSQKIASDLLKNIKTLSKEINCPIIITSQLDRRVELRTDKRPILSDLDDFDGLDQYVDTVVFLYRNDFYKRDFVADNKAEIIVAKQKKGPSGTVELVYTVSIGKYFSLAQE